MKAVLDAEKDREVLQINLEKQILQKKGESTLTAIQNNITRCHKTKEKRNHVCTHMFQINS